MSTTYAIRAMVQSALYTSNVAVTLVGTGEGNTNEYPIMKLAAEVAVKIVDADTTDPAPAALLG